MTRYRGLLVLLALFIVLAFLVALQNQQRAEAPLPTRAVRFQRVFPDLAVLDIQSVRLQDPNNQARQFTIERAADGTWQVPGSVRQLNENAGTNLARTVVLLPYSRTIPMPPSLAEYGFAPHGLLFVQVLLTNGASHIVGIGSRTADGSSYYALVDEREDLYILDRAPVDFFITQLMTPPVA